MNYLQDSEIIEQLPGYLGWKDKEGHYYGCNARFANLHKLSSSKKIIGLKDADLAGCTEELLAIHQRNDLIALSGEIVNGILPSPTAFGELYSYLVKQPLLDRENNIIGILFHCMEQNNPSIITNLIATDRKVCANEYLPSSYQIDQKNNPQQLTVRELECLFCILRGKTAKETSIILSLSKRTIEFYLDNIKNKFGCHTKSELVMSAIKMGYMNNIPALFLQDKYQHLF